MAMSIEQQKKDISRFVDAVTTMAQLEDRMSDLRALWNAAQLATEITDEACTEMNVAKQDIVDANNLFDAVVANGVTFANLISRIRKDLDYPAIR